MNKPMHTIIPTSLEGRTRRARLDALLARAARHKAQRGATILVVVLVIAMLTAVGLFAARTSALATRSAGAQRQMTQTHYVSEYAFNVVLQELRSDKKQAYLTTMADAGGLSGCTAVDPALLDNTTCYRFTDDHLEDLTSFSDLIAPPGGAGEANGLGHGNLEADMVVELTDLGPAAPPVKGFSLGGATISMQFYGVTVSVRGQVRPEDPDGDPTTGSESGFASSEFGRAHLVVGPLPTL